MNFKTMILLTAALGASTSAFADTHLGKLAKEEVNRRLSCAAGAVKWGLLPGTRTPASIGDLVREAYGPELGSTRSVGEQAMAAVWDPIVYPIVAPDLTPQEFLKRYTADVIGNETLYRLRLADLKLQILRICATGGKILFHSQKRQEAEIQVYTRLVEEGSGAAAK